MTPETSDNLYVLGEYEIILHIVSRAHIDQLHQIFLGEMRKELALELKLQLSSEFLMSYPLHLLLRDSYGLNILIRDILGLLHPNL